VRLSLNTATVRKQWNLAQIIDGCVRHGIEAIAPWRDQIAQMGLSQAAKSIRAAGLAVNGVCRGGFFGAKDWKDDNLRAIEEAHTLGSPVLILVVGGMPQGSRDLISSRKLIQDCIAEILPEARKAGVALAIEPLHPMQVTRAAVNTLEQALDMCDALGEGAGVAIDVYHVWWDPKLRSQIARAGKRVLGYHICDWLPATRDLFNDRGMMGDGLIDLPLIRSWVEAAGYSGFQEVEIFSDLDWWKRDPDEVLTTCKARLAVC
jgi:sugar phosphate isomerase/epimerase